MLSVLLILLGAAFCLAWAYALGVLCLRRLAACWEVKLAAGAAVESLLVFGLLLAGIAGAPVFLALGAVSGALAWRLRGAAGLPEPVISPAGRVTRVLAGGIFLAYGVFYFVHALAPEIQADAVGYHLGLVSEYLRLGRFPRRVGFFEMVPQGMEMLFTVAFSIGRHSAAKLVHFAFLLATLPLIVRIGRRLGLADTASLAAAGIYFCAPVTGVSGTCAYNDAALVFYILAVFYLLLVWRERQDDRYLVPAGLAAGFCYAIKFTGILILPLAMLAAVTAARKLRPAIFLAGGLVLIAPWMIRDAVLSGNPVAPLFDRWFPNPYFHPTLEVGLSEYLRSYHGFQLRHALMMLGVGGEAQGIYGPLLLGFPLGLVALRRRAGRWCWLAAALVAVPWFFNVGARFLMPSFAFASLALALALPRPAVLACLAFQAVSCWPQAVALYTGAGTWRLLGFPWQAALRIEPEDQYLMRVSEDYAIDQMIQTHTRPGERIFALQGVAGAYTDRETLTFWYSAQGDHLLDALSVAAWYAKDPFYDVNFNWPAQSLGSLRFRLTTAHPGEWCIHEIFLYLDEERIHNSPEWTLSGWPNPWELPLAFDNNLATRCRTWSPMQPGMYAQVDLDRPQTLSRATLISHTPVYGVPMELYGMGADGRWRSLGAGKPVRRTWLDIRRQAMRAVKREGFQYVLAPIGSDGNGPLGDLFVGHEQEWGIERVAEYRGLYLYRIR